jgi:hypothetical protein
MIFLCAAAMTLGGCTQANGIHGDPVGRFQMTPIDGGKGGVYVLDTQKGQVWICSESATTGAPLCGLRNDLMTSGTLPS